MGRYAYGYAIVCLSCGGYCSLFDSKLVLQSKVDILFLYGSNADLTTVFDTHHFYFINPIT